MPRTRSNARIQPNDDGMYGGAYLRHVVDRFPKGAFLAVAIGFGSFGCATEPLPEPSGEPVATGFVFDDRNGNGLRDRFDSGIGGVAVSNGRDVVRTDRQGRYRLPISNDAIVFVIKPSGYSVPLSESLLPRFYYRHKPAGSPPELHFPGVEATGPLPDSIDFPLTRASEPDAFDVVLFGDTQTYTTEQIDLLAHDVIEEVVGTDAAFGISLGDLVGDDLSLFEPLNRAMALVGIPWHHVPGNHDMNFLASGDSHADETYERVFGPGTYAFEYASAHFILLDNVVYGGAVDGKPATQNYIGGLSADQLLFVRNYLAHVPESHLVVVAMHIPLSGVIPSQTVPERGELLAALARHPNNFSVSSHMHTQRNDFYGESEGWTGPTPHHHLVQGTTSGSWWMGSRDESGLPHATMRDGTPNGYSILHVDGNSYSVRFKAARRPADYQMTIFAPDVVPASEAAEAEVLVNFFSGSDRSRVEMRLDESEAWTPLERVERSDPYFVELKRREFEASTPPERPLPPADPSTHLWVGRLPVDPPKGSAALEVRATDAFGSAFTAHRVIRFE